MIFFNVPSFEPSLTNTYSNTGWSTSYYKGNTNAGLIGVYYWNNSANNTWSQSNLNTLNLNQNYISNIGSKWSDLIATTSWKVGGSTYQNIYNVPVKQTYQNEIVSPSDSTIYGAKIGLMYVSDYGYAASPENWNTNLYNYDSDTNRNNNWMFMGLYDWTISRNSDSTEFAFIEDYTGSIGYGAVNYRISSVRPVFYLGSSVEFSEGDGTKQNPYRIVI